jgi:hypothetical protein
MLIDQRPWCRALRKRLVVSDIPASGASAASVNRGYGVHMAVGLSIGFLFLGGSCYKFNTSSSSVAMLLISMWPVLPSGPSDNRCHLQVGFACCPLASCAACLFQRAHIVTQSMQHMF